MKEVLLNGNFDIYEWICENGQYTHVGEKMTADLPCNLEKILLAKAAKDVYFGNNIQLVQEYEDKNYVFIKKFPAERVADAYLEFERVDIYAEYYLNGIKIGESDNALIEHRFPIGDVLKDGENELKIYLTSARNKAYEGKYEPNQWACLPQNFETLYMRKPAHSSAWDIMPRTMLGGIVGDAKLVYPDEVYFNDVYLGQKYAEKDRVELRFFYDYQAPAHTYGKYKVKLRMQCGDRVHEEIFDDKFRCGTHFITFPNPVLWYPNGIGEQNLYEVSVSVFEGEKTVAEKKFRYGIRSVRLERTDLSGDDGKFYFVVNGNKVKLSGANWIPLSVLHADDDRLLEETVKAARDVGCNVLRVWGGGVYEKDRFYELCDEYGIFVWQDFMLSCHVYPQDGKFIQTMEKEAISFVRRVHNHCSILLYCGGNEMDWSWRYDDIDPNKDVLTRELFPNVLLRYDPYREYIACTPEYTHGFIESQGLGFIHSMEEVASTRTKLPDDHFWWHRQDFRKVEICKQHFISESGFSSAPNKENILKYIGEEYAPISMENPAWASRRYSTEGDFTSGVKLLFGEIPQNPDEFIAASQYYQGEAYKKYFEYMRLSDRCDGVIIWVLKDSWFEFGSGIIDAFGGKKVSCTYVKNAQEPIQIILTDEKEVWLVNNTIYEKECSFTIVDENGTELLSGKATTKPFSKQRLGAIEAFAEGALSVLTIDGKTVRNHKYFLPLPYDKKKYFAFIEKVLRGQS